MSESTSHLEQRARALLAGREHEGVREELKPDELLQVVHELHVHQIELELQNEELRDATRHLEESRAALAISGRKYLELFDDAPVGYMRLDHAGVIKEANKTASELLQVERSTLNGRKLSDFVTPDHQDPYYLHSQSAKRAERPAPVRVGMVRPEGDVRDVELSARPMPDRPNEICIALLDVSDRERADAEIHEVKRQLRGMADALPLAVSRIAADGTFVLCNRAFRSLYAVSANEVEGRSLFKFIDDPTYAAWRRHIREALSGRSSRFEGDLSFPRIGGRSVSVLFAPDFGPAGETCGFYVTIDDRTGLQQARRSLREVASQAALAEERERKALADDLHDQAGQLLSLAAIKIRFLDEQIADTALAESAQEVTSLIREARESISTLSFELSPPLLYDVGFVAAVEWLADNLSDRYGLSTQISKTGDVPDLDEAALVTLFRVVRELLINVAKHSGSNRASLSIDGNPEEVGVAVSDNGVGFDARGSRNGYGLNSVIDRVEALGGRVDIDSAVDRGARVSVRLPTTGSESS